MNTKIYVWDKKESSFIENENLELFSMKSYNNSYGELTTQIFLTEKTLNVENTLKEHDEFIESTKQFLKDIDLFLKVSDVKTSKYLIKRAIEEFQDDNVEVLEQ